MFLNEEDKIEIENTEDGEFLNGDGCHESLFGYAYWKIIEETEDLCITDFKIQKLSEIKEDIIAGKIKKDEDGYLFRV